MSNRTTYSCIKCTERKVKCDRQRPCSACIKQNNVGDCVFHPIRPSRKSRVKHQLLADQLKHYEDLLKEHGIDPSEPPVPAEVKSPGKSSNEAATEQRFIELRTSGFVPSRTFNKTQLVHSQGRYQLAENPLWSRVVEEFHSPEDVFNSSSGEGSGGETSDDDFCFVLSTPPKYNGRIRHPPPEHILQLWTLFVDNVDPLTKVVHVPTLRLAIHRAVANIGCLPRGFEALMFAIYGAAIMSLGDTECKERFSEPRQTLLSRYITATKRALSRAKFMSTMSLVVLQGLILHLISVRDVYEPRAVWSLTGVAVRIAQSMGMERDGKALGLPPFEVEMRRRVWWLLRTHDYRTAELCGLAKFRDIDTSAESTKWATNVSDDQLYPTMRSIVCESAAVTDFVFLAIKQELTKFATSRIAQSQREGKDFNFHAIHAPAAHKILANQAAKELEELLEMKYLRYCDPSQPLHLMTMLMARAAMNVIRFLSHHPRRWASLDQTPPSERQWIWEIGVKLLDQQNMLQSNPTLKQFAWYAAYFMQWHAFIHVLDTLRADPCRADAEKAWHLVRRTFENNPGMIEDTKKPVHVAVGNLCLKAYSVWEQTREKSSRAPVLTPKFILELRRQRDIAIAKFEMRSEKYKAPANPNGDAVTGSYHDEAGRHAFLPRVESMQLNLRTLPVPPGITQTSDKTANSSFWSINGFDDIQTSSTSPYVDNELDKLLTQDFTMEDNPTESISWEKWDAWLAMSTAPEMDHLSSSVALHDVH